MRGLADDAVDGHVRRDLAVHVAATHGRVPLDDEGAQAGDVLRRPVQGREPGGADLEGAPHLEDVHVMGAGHPAAHGTGEFAGGEHVGAGALPPLEQPGVDQ